MPPFAALAGAGAMFTPAVHEALVDGLYAAGSETALVLVQDVFGSRARINTPATIANDNWSWRLPDEIEQLAGTAGRERAGWLRAIARRHGRANWLCAPPSVRAGGDCCDIRLPRASLSL